MTYGLFLPTFLIPPIVALTLTQRAHLTRRRLGYVGALATIAFLYTPIWDNYLVANEIWWYDPAKIWGITLAWVPLEEYLFFILQPIMTGLWLLAWHDRLSNPAPFKPDARIRGRMLAGLGAVWGVSGVLLFFGARDWQYLTLILFWAMPPLMLQAAFGADVLWHQRRLVAFIIGTATLYLSVADSLAISAWGIWTIGSATSLDINLLGVLPIEEFIFFGITNTLEPSRA